MPSDSQYVFIFDYDDTLFPTTSLTMKGGFDEDELKLIQNGMINILSEAKKLGKVHIVTNAEEGWVEKSMKTYLPEAVYTLNGINVVSARTKHEKKSSDPTMWKYHAMSDCLEDSLLCPVDFSSTGINHVISIGDSNYERSAINLLAEDFNDFYVKSVKLREKPTVFELTKELELLSNSLRFLCSHKGNLDLMTSINRVNDGSE